MKTTRLKKINTAHVLRTAINKAWTVQRKTREVARKGMELTGKRAKFTGKALDVGTFIAFIAIAESNTVLNSLAIIPLKMLSAVGRGLDRVGRELEAYGRQD